MDRTSVGINKAVSGGGSSNKTTPKKSGLASKKNGAAPVKQTGATPSKKGSADSAPQKGKVSVFYVVKEMYRNVCIPT